MLTPEHIRLAESENRRADWKRWGPYVSDRAWGTVREDYSSDGKAWDYFPHDHARSRAYRWNEDGIAGVCDRHQNICMAVALWNENDPILKERFFGLTGEEGNHGEDVKEYYFYLDSTPTHSYMKMLYKYPQRAFPYADLVKTNRTQGKRDHEYELINTGIFSENRYFDVFIEYAKAETDNDVFCRVTVVNRGPEPAPIHVLPHIWFRNTWSWTPNSTKPLLKAASPGSLKVEHSEFPEAWWYVNEAKDSRPELLFTENETNTERLFGSCNATPYVKDGINEAVVGGKKDAVNPALEGTKAAAHYKATVNPGESFVVETRFTTYKNADPFADIDDVFEKRIEEADEFYAAIQNPALSKEESAVQRQAFAGLLWSKQFYNLDVDLWLKGDPQHPRPRESVRNARNRDWKHLNNFDVISMPDKWEYPWYAVWDLAFHCLPLALLDPEWAKRQLILVLREWYMHPNGQLPAYEWNFSDVNPPVHAWAAWRVYKITRPRGQTFGDKLFLERIFHKLLLNFTWWVNRKDQGGNNIFQGGFLGLDNIGVFDRSAPLPVQGHLEQADGTAWMGMYCLNMLAISLELARMDPAYEDVATKFFEHFIWIANAINNLGDEGVSLWDEHDGFYYDVLHEYDGVMEPLRARSFVGLIPLFAVETIEPDLLELLPRFKRRMDWFIHERPEMVKGIASLTNPGDGGRRLLSIVDKNKLGLILKRMLDSKEFLSDYGLRSMSKYHETHPYTCNLGGSQYRVGYDAADSTSDMFGGNSNWRGPVWFPLNFLMVESLQKYHHYYGDGLKVELPTGSGNLAHLDDVATEISRRLISLFLKDNSNGDKRPVFGGVDTFNMDPHWRDHILFYEFFHGDNGAGIGASHQTGWTALVAKLIQQRRGQGSEPGS